MSAPSIRDTIRAKTVGAPKRFHSRFVEVLEDGGCVTHDEKPAAPDGHLIEVRSPTMATKSRLAACMRVKQGSGDGIEVEVDSAKQSAIAIVECCFVPGTAERVFEEHDVQAIMSSPDTGYVSALSAAALDLYRGAIEEGKASGTTRTGS